MSKALKQKKPFIILGIGNDFRGDDGFGIAVAKTLRDQFQLQHVHISRGDATELLAYFEQTHCLVLIDAIYSPAHPPGQAQYFPLDQLPETATQLRSSTHLVSINEALALGDLYGKLPEQVHIFGVTAENFAQGADISDQVRQNIWPTCVKIAALVNALTTPAPHTVAPSSAKS